MATEDRGTAYRTWSDGRLHSLSPFPGADRVASVSVPIGWSLAQSPHGVHLQNVFGRRLRPSEVHRYAAASHDGFRLLSAGIPPRPPDTDLAAKVLTPFPAGREGGAP